MRRLYWVLLFLFASAPTVFGGGFPTLKLGSDARSTGMGMAYVAVAEGGSAGFWNPSALTFQKKRHLLFSMHRWIEGVGTTFFGLDWGGEEWGVALNVLYTEIGDIEQRLVPSPEPLSTFSTNELIFGFSVARRMGPHVGIGATVKGLYEKILFDEAMGIALDVGILWHLWPGGLRIGGVVQNIGKTNHLVDEDIPLPLTSRVGLAFPLRLFGNGCLLVADGIKERGFPFHLHTGIEFGWRDVLFFRLGYQTGYDIRDVTGGVGVVWRGYRVDYSYIPLKSGWGDSHRLSVGIGW